MVYIGNPSSPLSTSLSSYKTSFGSGAYGSSAVNDSVNLSVNSSFSSAAPPMQPNSKQPNTQSESFKIGDIVQVTSVEIPGIIRFIGPTKNSEKVWIGIEFDEPVGRCDGSAHGILV